MAPEPAPNVVRFPRQCPKCSTTRAMPFRAGTLAEGRTQLDLKCDDCGQEWSIEMSPPLVIVQPARHTDDAAPHGNARSAEDASGPNSAAANEIADRRHARETHPQRMRVGLCGLLTSMDRSHTVAVLYSLDADRVAGRLRLLNPRNRFPSWLDRETRPTLSGYDGLPLPIRITTIKPPREGLKDDDHFAEFVVSR